MKRALAVLLLFVAVSAFAVEETDLARGLINLAWMHGMAQALEFRTFVGASTPLTEVNDPWGTPYRIEVTAGGYQIVSAGSDKAFDPTSWTTEGQLGDLAADAVFANGRLTRSHRNWLVNEAGKSGKPSAAVEMLRKAERQFMISRTDWWKNRVAFNVTYDAMTKFAEAMKGAGGAAPPRDAWGTPLRLVTEGTSYRIVSAGADRKFDEESWSRPAAVDANEDVVYADGAFVRRIEDAEWLKQSKSVPPVAQPTDMLPVHPPEYHRVGGDVKAPVVTTRVEPVYPEEYRMMRISGIVIIEAVISATGDVTGVRLLKSVAPDIDAAALDAVRKWKFTPGTLNGNPVPVIFNLTVNFKLT